MRINFNFKKENIFVKFVLYVIWYLLFVKFDVILKKKFYFEELFLLKMRNILYCIV